ncbi:MAG: hypothetical protein A3G32_01690 [Deltaproteobacteria bacterium RIFCSPLOWO2_12_FULL_40_28]|nr:MAG: hypothetical protein A3C45_06435 [Deltaproteobacteria bacterium RIFCSPHIGHO2_02_FULL_40_28]OGQ18844.1 MAG: hypothetical protein A3E27_09070 [Deltaproteobacteria bacterium RIFCSPHIGHO2_12_FULL_40_32]OGQ40089.1 MAG: hypothetical protein A3I69_01600 [Deltaproteobacteria bacterium RIFCSPLOWO2_02_FULL_40_36]OGQ53272.1 MAG: hypothetical protein A3G32_01690 [Deltaproteobacteria bacterium RIFCSPLOWO2_12_FULL_40_28]
MLPEKKKKYIQELIGFYQLADEILKTKPNLDRETLVQTFFAQKKSPFEKLQLALMRGQAIRASFKKINNAQ